MWPRHDHGMLGRRWWVGTASGGERITAHAANAYDTGCASAYSPPWGASTSRAARRRTSGRTPFFLAGGLRSLVERGPGRVPAGHPLVAWRLRKRWCSSATAAAPRGPSGPGLGHGLPPGSVPPPPSLLLSSGRPPSACVPEPSMPALLGDPSGPQFRPVPRSAISLLPHTRPALTHSKVATLSSMWAANPPSHPPAVPAAYRRLG